MSYTIHYSQQYDNRYPAQKRKQTVKPGGILCLILFVASLVYVRTKGVPDILIPGEPSQTKAAATEMISSLRDGQPFADAVTVFCREIIHGSDSGN